VSKPYRPNFGEEELIKNTSVVCGLLVATVALMIAAGACGGGGQDTSAEEEGQGGAVLATDPFELEPGLAIVEMDHRGEGDFVVDLLSMAQNETASTPGPIEFSGDQNGGNDAEASFPLAQKTGPAHISRAVTIPTGGGHVFGVKADGPWEIKVEQPRPSDAPETTTFSGEGATATPFFRLSSGSKQVAVNNPLKENLEISLLDRDGNAVEAAFVDETDRNGGNPAANISTAVDIDEDGIYLFDIQTEGLWTIEITDAEEPDDARQLSSMEWGVEISTGSVLLVLLINLIWLLILATIIWSRGPEQKRPK
jgi:hypothetical protein